MMIIFGLILLTTFLLVNIPVYFLIRRVLPHAWLPQFLFALAFVALVVIFAYALFSRHSLSLKTSAVIDNYAVTWLLGAFYFLLAYGIFGIVLLLNKWLAFLPYDTHTIFAKRITVTVILVVVFAVLIYGRQKYNNIKVENLEIEINKKANVESLKIVAASDLHLGYSIDKQRLQKYVEIINAQKPDIILLIGDIADNSPAPLIEQNMHDEFLQLHAPLGVYAVLGNHDNFGNPQKLTEYLESANVNVLQDQAVLLNCGIYIVGRNDKSTPRKSLLALLQNIDKSKPVIVLDHQPFHLEEAQNAGADLQLSGHTHAGQVFPLSIITKSVYEQNFGYLRKGNTQYYISCGLGLWGPKERIGSQSEIAVINVKFKN